MNKCYVSTAKAASLHQAIMRGLYCEHCICMLSGCYTDCLAECWSMIGHFAEHYLEGKSVIGNADHG